MWIFLGIIGFILLLITIILLLPITVIIKTDRDGELVLLYKILFKTFGENPDPNQPIVKALKEISGVERLKKPTISKEKEFVSILRDDISLIIGLLKRLLELLKQCRVKVLKIDIVCAEEDAASTAINYGICYAVISPLLNLLHGSMKVRKRGEQINIRPDFSSNSGSFDFKAVLVIPVFRVVAAIWNLAFDEARRINDSRAKKPENQKLKP